MFFNIVNIVDDIFSEQARKVRRGPLAHLGNLKQTRYL